MPRLPDGGHEARAVQRREIHDLPVGRDDDAPANPHDRVDRVPVTARTEGAAEQSSDHGGGGQRGVGERHLVDPSPLPVPDARRLLRVAASLETALQRQAHGLGTALRCGRAHIVTPACRRVGRDQLFERHRSESIVIQVLGRQRVPELVTEEDLPQLAVPCLVHGRARAVGVHLAVPCPDEGQDRLGARRRRHL